MQHYFIDQILFNYSYLQLFGLITFYFIFLYFGLAPVFLEICKYLADKNIVHRIAEKEPSRDIIFF